MASFWSRLNPFSSKSYTSPIANKNFRSGAGEFLFGSPEVRENVSLLRPEQEALYQQLVKSGIAPGAGGAFGGAADYYRNLLGDNSADYAAFAAPMLRQYNQEIVPNISEQFAGLGSGGLSSSGFRNAQIQGATDLAERLGALRANLRQAGAQGLQNIGQLGLQSYSQNMTTQPGSEGFLSSLAPAVGGAIGTAVGGPIGGAIGSGIGSSFGNASQSWFGNQGNRVGANSSPYGGVPKASPSFNSNFQLPNFLQR
ncbi:MAG: hypothetical protein ABFD00_10610 [Chloroherpetonaceae bacterium]